MASFREQAFRLGDEPLLCTFLGDAQRGEHAAAEAFLLIEHGKQQMPGA